MTRGLRWFVVSGDRLGPETVRQAVSGLGDDERARFSRMADPVAADVRAVLRAEANRLRASGHAVSVSHSGRHGVLGFFAGTGPVGIDCEPWSGDMPDDAWVREVASPGEFAAWRTVPSAGRREAFVRLWALKEAGFKAGVARTMAEVGVDDDFRRLSDRHWVSGFSDVLAGHAVAHVTRAGGELKPAARIGLNFDFDADGGAVTVPPDTFSHNASKP